MADNVDHLLQDGGPEDRVIVWAHNGHVTRNSHGLFAPDVMTMGKYLVERHGDRYLAVGFTFGAGSFQAIVDADEDTARLEEIDVGTPRAGSLNRIFMDAAEGLGFQLDTRGQTGELASWLLREQRTRETGAVFASETEMYAQVLPAARYDVLAFVRDTTRSRPTATGHRPRRGPVASG